MNAILLPVAIVAGIGLLAGLGLAIASIVMAVPKDEKAEAVLEVLPGANCGACGYSGCSGYAAALAKGEAQPGLCSPAGSRYLRQSLPFWGWRPAKRSIKPPWCTAWAATTTPPIACAIRVLHPALRPPSCLAAQGSAPGAVWDWGTVRLFANTGLSRVQWACQH